MLHPDLTGQRLGQYILRQRIGVGGMSVVYEAFQANIKRKVAIKILPAYMAANDTNRQRFEREVELAARLEHPNILPIYDYGTETDLSYIVMRLLQGGTLQERIERYGRPPLKRGLRIIWQVANALIYAHTHNIIHRDLKASNVLFDNHQNAYLADFGLARALAAKNNITDTGQVVGTPAYMAPEQWSGDSVDTRADIYALGILTYYVVTGVLPFDGDTPFILMHKHLHEFPKLPSEFSQELTREFDLAIFTALAKQAENRFGKVERFIEALRLATMGQRVGGTGLLPNLEKQTPGDEHSRMSLQVVEDVTTTLPNKRHLRPKPEIVFSEESQHLLDILEDPRNKPSERLKAGLSLNQFPDPRFGVGCRRDGLPDIDWIEIPPGAFVYQEHDSLLLSDFYISRYPITFKQFQVFVEAADGYYNPMWWEAIQGHPHEVGDAKWRIDNHPRDNITWYEAMIFCRWLNSYSEIFPFEPDAFTDQEGWEIRLPSEQEWEKAARGDDGRLYPWGNDYWSGYANVDELSSRMGSHFLRRAVPVGLYPFAASPYGVMDMSGNVWEWCLTEYDTGLNRLRMDNTLRVLRGGSWDESVHNAKVTFRHYLGAINRSYGGFRIVFARPPYP